MSRLTTIELFKDDMKFSSGHFAIFSAEHRERLHGHNFSVKVALTAQVQAAGYAFDYRIYKKKIIELCKSVNEVFLIPQDCPYLDIETDDSHHHITFNHETMSLLKHDVKLLPLRNITVEELSCWLIDQLASDPEEIKQHGIEQITVQIFTNPGQSGSTTRSF